MLLNVAAYRFTRIDDCTAFADELRTCATAGSVRGTVLVAPEGLNLFLAGEPSAVESVLAVVRSRAVFENIAVPLREHTQLNEDEIEARVKEKLEFVDLEPNRVMDQLPAELSGGMKKRVGIARGMAVNPAIMLYDEPTSGLDPLTTGTITRLIMKLQRELKVTSVVVSHDIRSAFRMATKIALLAEKRIVFFGSPEEMTASQDRYVQDFLGGV